MDKQGELGY